MNYRHHFHAGNFADIVKHAVLLALVDAMARRGPPVEVFDTHAGAGVYDLQGEAAQRSRESDAGVRRLMADAAAPAAYAALKAQVRLLNRGAGAVRLYPGSPWLAARALRRGDRYVGCELRPDDHAALVQALRPPAADIGPELRLEQRDGFDAAADLAAQRPRTLMLIDPPYERGDDYARIAATLAASLRRRPDMVAAVWAPIKDLETFDALLRRLDGLGFDAGLIAETRLRPLTDPLRLNGCAMILLAAGREAGVLETMAAPTLAACEWAALSAGGPTGVGRVDAWGG